ncbi:MAG: hypothetical protein JST00_03960 [Deltaproteobacteria bacterium]|nr:hypothetical protein [Deltaproteobacteria bacterium]
MTRRLALVAALLVTLLAPRAALAQKPVSKTTEYSPYEKETIKNALDATGLRVDPAPEGKTVERIDVVRLEVLEPRDPIPEEVVGIKTRKLLNSLHYTSRDFVIRREMLVQEGEPYVQVLVDETARNMRARMPFQVSIVIILPVKSEDPDKVGLLVITKDIWSLRLSFDLGVTPGGLERFLLKPQETNLLGWHHTAATQFLYQPESLSFGVSYDIPRFGKSWIGAGAGVGVIVNRRSGELEGSSASINVGQGLYSTRTEWAWGADTSYSVGVARTYSNAAVLGYASPALSPGARAACIAANVPDCNRIPITYRSRSVSAAVGATRSFGWGFKNNFNVSFGAALSDYEPFDLSRFNPVAAADFVQQRVPVGENRVGPTLTWTTFGTSFLRTLDVSALALQEDIRLGHTASVAVYPVLRAFGSTRDLVGIKGSAGYTVPLGDGFASASVSAGAENQLTDLNGDSSNRITDASVSGGFAIVTPRLGFGRLFFATSATNRFRNYLRGRSTIGGDDRLRGYPSNLFTGKDVLVMNMEFRTTSVEILKCAFGAVAFLDAGDAANGFDNLRLKQSAGFGLRALFPQVNRAVFRADLAFPLKRGPFPESGIDTQVDPVGFFFSFNQAF